MNRLLRLPLLAAAGLLFASFAAADTITSPADVESSTDLEAEIEALFGSSGPFWTTTANLAEIDYLLGLAADSAEDTSTSELAIVLEEEDGSGTLPLDLPSGAEPSSSTSEPATLVLLGGGLFLLAGYAAKGYGARQRTYRSGGD